VDKTLAVLGPVVGQDLLLRKEAFPNAKRAFIANYNETKHDGWKIKTWENFIDYLEKKDDNDPLIIGYIKYLKKLMGYLEVKDMDLNNVKSLPDFYNILEKVIKENDYNGKKLFFNNSIKSIDQYRFGRSVYYEKNGKTINFWIGLHYCDDNDKVPYLSIEFNVGDNDSVPKKEAEIIKKLPNKSKYFYLGIYEGIAYFELGDEGWEILFSEKPESEKPELEKQKEVIRNFLGEILEKL